MNSVPISRGPLKLIHSNTVPESVFVPPMPTPDIVIPDRKPESPFMDKVNAKLLGEAALEAAKLAYQKANSREVPATTSTSLRNRVTVTIPANGPPLPPGVYALQRTEDLTARAADNQAMLDEWADQHALDEYHGLTLVSDSAATIHKDE